MIEFVEGVFIELEWVELPADVAGSLSGERSKEVRFAGSQKLLHSLHVAAGFGRLVEAHRRRDDASIRIEWKLTGAPIDDRPLAPIAASLRLLLDVGAQPLLAEVVMRRRIAEGASVTHHLERELLPAAGVDCAPLRGLRSLPGPRMPARRRTAQALLGSARDTARI